MFRSNVLLASLLVGAVRAIVSVLKSEDFPKLVRGIPGYDASRAGEFISVADVSE